MIYFCFRDTLDWESVRCFKNNINTFFSAGREEEGAGFRTPRSQSTYKKYLDFWNKTQPVNFFEYRKKLKEITKLTFLDANINEINVENWRDLSNEDWLIPIDDDDWFCCNFKKHINSTMKILFMEIV